MDTDGGGGGGQLKIKKDAEVGTGSVEVHSEIYGCSGVIGVSEEGAEDGVRWKHLIGHGHLLWEQPREGDSSADLLLHF